MNSYKDCSSDPQLMRQILYLMDYKSILALGPNILMTKDDHLHFTLILSAYPQLVKPDYLDNILVERASEMIIELMAERREEYVYYIAMMPEERMISAVSSIIVSSDAIDTFIWRKLR